MKIKYYIILLLIPLQIVAQFTNEFDLSSIDDTNGLVIYGEGANQRFGTSVSGTGDFNNDGKMDITIGAPNTGGGKAFTIFGANINQNNPFNILSINGGNGFVATGEGAIGITVSSAGDFNGDGIDDMIIASYSSGSNVNFNGIAYLVYGNDQPLLQSLNLKTLSNSQGFIINKPSSINGSSNDFTSNFHVAKAGDLNNDGFDDVVISAVFGSFSNVTNGTVYVIYGSNTNLVGPFNLDAINGTNGVMMYGEIDNEKAGYAISGAGDFNGDGIDDLIIGAPGAKPNGTLSGKTYVVFGNNTINHPFALSSINGVNGVKINGENFFDYSASAVAGDFDFNGDGYKDILIGAHRKKIFGYSLTGRAYIVYGHGNPFNAEIELSTMTLSEGLKINGLNENDRFGFSVSSAGNFNGDRFDDVIIGGTHLTTDSITIASAIIYGTNQPFTNGIDGTMDLFPLFAQYGTRIKGRKQAGYSVGLANDFNNDGLDDVMIGSPSAELDNVVTGAAYVIYGNDIIFSSSF